jgi:hypothetical protein
MAEPLTGLCLFSAIVQTPNFKILIFRIVKEVQINTDAGFEMTLLVATK